VLTKKRVGHDYSGRRLAIRARRSFGPQRCRLIFWRSSGWQRRWPVWAVVIARTGPWTFPGMAFVLGVDRVCDHRDSPALGSLWGAFDARRSLIG